MSRVDRREVLAALGGSVAVGLAGCTGGGDSGGDTETTESEMDTPMDTPMQTESEMTPSGTARLRAAHMAPDAPNVDVLVDGSAVRESLPFREATGYLEAPAGERQVTITEAGNRDNAVFDQALTVEDGTDYTLVAAGELTSDDTAFQVLPLVDENTDPGGNQTKLRAVHVSPDAGAVDVTVNVGVTLFDGVEFTDSGYFTGEANDYTVQVRPDTETNDGEVVYDTDVSLNGGTVYTAFASGYLTPDDEPADESFEQTVVQDASY